MSVLTTLANGVRTRGLLCASTIFVSGAGVLVAGDQLLLESRTLSRDGTDITVVLPSGPVVLSSKVVATCLPGIRNDDDVLSFNLDTGECQFIPGTERGASPLMQRPAVEIGVPGSSISILDCLVSHRGVLVRETSKIALCFDWYACDDLTPAIVGDPHVCAGSSLILDAGAGYSSYLWEPGGETTQTIDVSPGADTPYAVTVTDEWLCAGADVHPVTVVPLPEPGITGPEAVCQGGEVTLEATPGYDTYSWTPGGETTHSISIVPTMTTQYQVTVTNEAGCAGAASQTVVVNPNPTPSITGPTSVCEGPSVTLDAGPGYTSYFWQPGGETTREIEVDPVATTHYSVMVWDANGCAAESAPHVVDVIVCVPEIFSDNFETGDTSRWSHVAF